MGNDNMTDQYINATNRFYWMRGSLERIAITDREWLEFMRLAEATLTDTQSITYYCELGGNPVFCRAPPKNVRTQPYLVISATWQQRAVAFLKVKGLWK